MPPRSSSAAPTAMPTIVPCVMVPELSSESVRVWFDGGAVMFIPVVVKRVPSKPSRLPPFGFCSQPAFKAVMTVIVLVETAYVSGLEYLTVGHVR